MAAYSADKAIPLSLPAQGQRAAGHGRGSGASSAPHPGSTERVFSERPPNWIIFDPGSLFLSLATIFSPLRFTVFLLPVILLVGIAVVGHNFNLLVFDINRVKGPTLFFPMFLCGLFFVNSISQLCNGIVRRGLGMDVDGFGIRLVLGFFPLFGIQSTGIVRLEKSDQMLVHAAPLVARLVLFGFCISLWLMTRENGTNISLLFLVVANMSVFSFLLNANPFFNSNGSRFLAIWLDSPNLRSRSFRTLSYGKKSDPKLSKIEKFALKAFAIGCIIFLILVIGLAAVLSALWLEANLQGVGVVLFLAACGMAAIRFTRRPKQRSRIMNEASEQGQRPEFDAKSKLRELVKQQKEGQETEHPGKESPPPRRWSWRYLSLPILLILAFFPYPYETGGAVTIAPARQEPLYAHVNGAVREVYVNGNERLQKGTLIAELTSVQQAEDVKTTEASIVAQRAKVEALLSTPTPEELKLAEEKVKLVEVKLKYSEYRAKRLQALVDQGNVSIDDYEDELRKKETYLQEIEETKARLADVAAGPNANDIEAARAELSSLEERLIHRKMRLDLTQMVMPFDGHLLTSNLRDKRGLYLEDGDFFAMAEQNDSVRVHIRIPETDIADVDIGASVRVKVWSYPDRIFEGEITEISREVTDEQQREFMLALAVIPNEEGTLQTGMTGFAKIDGGTKFTIVAFTRMFVRFFRIEVWSWIP